MLTPVIQDLAKAEAALHNQMTASLPSGSPQVKAQCQHRLRPLANNAH